MNYKENIDLQKLPAHIAIIMDGNGRWAKQKGFLRASGQEEGTKAVRDVVEGCAELGVRSTPHGKGFPRGVQRHAGTP